MLFVNAAPEYVTAAATDLANIGSSISSANVAAFAPTSELLAAGADDVSVVVATLFQTHAQAYQALSAQAAVFHNQFVQLLNAGAGQYAAAEAANASPLQTIEQDVLGVVNAPTELLLGRPLIGNGVSAPPREPGQTVRLAGCCGARAATAGRSRPRAAPAGRCSARTAQPVW